jgi:hypothetical protein
MFLARAALTCQGPETKENGMIEKLVAEVKLDLAIVAELVLGFLFWLLLLGLLPKDTLNFNVTGSIVLWAAVAGPYWLARRYVKAHLIR